MEIILYLDIPLYLQQYLSSFFTKENNSLVINCTNGIGKYLNSILKIPEGFQKATKGIKIVLPRNKAKNNRFLYNNLSKADSIKFIDFLQTNFDTEFHRWILRADQINIDKKLAYQLFMKKKNISVDTINIEALKKKDYRFRKKIEIEFNNALQSLVY